MKTSKWKYSPHHFPHVEGHIYLGDDVKGACTITLTPAASMTQPQLDRYGRKIVRAINKLRK